MQALTGWAGSAPLELQALIALGAVLGLWAGSEAVILGVRRFAKDHGISEFLIGLTLVSIASSLPEIFVNVSAALKGADDVGVGNIVGSCYAQITLILGICVLIGGQLSEDRRTLWRDGSVVLAATAAVPLFALDRHIGPTDAAILTASYVVYLLTLYFLHRRERNLEFQRQRVSETLNVDPGSMDEARFLGWVADRQEESEPRSSRDLSSLALMVGGAAVVWLMADLLIVAGIGAGQELGVPDAIIGLWAGVGTSLPELAISLAAILRGSAGISLGNLLGSNITDPLLSLSIGALVSQGYVVSDFMMFKAIPLWVASTLGVILVFLIKGSFGRREAAVAVALYLGSYVYFLS